MMQLCKLCGSEADHRKPIYHNGLTYVTNGYYVLRCAGRVGDAADVTEENRNMAAYMESLFPRCDEIAGMLHAPHVGKMQIVCDNCNGGGLARPCRECGGEGEVVFENPYSHYECCCLSCDGYGQVAADRDDTNAKRCLHCQGTGKEVDESKPVRIGKARLNPHHMHILSQLLLIAWAEHGPHGYFIFCGGDGVLMGLQTPPEED